MAVSSGLRRKEKRRRRSLEFATICPIRIGSDVQDRAERVKAGVEEAKKRKRQEAGYTESEIWVLGRKLRGSERMLPQPRKPRHTALMQQGLLRGKADDLLESLYGGLPPPDPKKDGPQAGVLRTPLCRMRHWQSR